MLKVGNDLPGGSLSCYCRSTDTVTLKDLCCVPSVPKNMADEYVKT